MKLSDKLIELRKEKGWSQEDFAEKLDVSRQAISRWENGSALPDAQNILRISKLFSVSADYLLNDDHEGERDIPASDALTEETAPLVQKKKFPYWWLITAACFVILTVCIIYIVKISGEVHSKHLLSGVKENEIAPTCTAEGSYDEVVYCTDCNAEILRTHRTVNRIAHTPSSSVKENEVAPSCTVEGSYDDVIYCAKCKDVILRTKIKIEKLEHQFKNRKCSVCGEDQPSEGLLYMSGGNGTCTVDIGDCTDENIVIPSYSPIGDKVVQVKAYAFSGQSDVISVKIPDTVTIVGEGAFQDCFNLESVTLPKKITAIHSYTFRGCENLKEITIPSGVTYIGIEAFADCVSCESITIPARVTKIGQFAFRNFSNVAGTVIFEVYEGWALCDESESPFEIVDFKNSHRNPCVEIAWAYSEYTWKRIY